MKPFDYYDTNPIPYPDRAAYRRELETRINDEPMAAAAREGMLRNVPNEVSLWMKEARKPYDAKEAELKQEFWHDCREDLGYADVFTPVGVALLEDFAWEHGHANGFADVHSILCDMVTIGVKLINNTK